VSDKSFEIIVENEKAFNQSSSSTFVTGFHGLGAVGYISIKHFIDELNLERVAVVQSSAAPPFISLTESGGLAHAFELYATVDYKIHFFFPRLPPYRHGEVEFSKLLGEWVVENYSKAYLVGGVDKRLREENDTRPAVRYIPTRKYTLLNMDTSPKLPLLPAGLFVQGPLAVMLGVLDLRSFPALGVLAFAERDRPDPEGSANAVKVANDLLGLSCSVEELLKNAALFEEELLKSQQVMPPQDGNAPPETYL